MDEQRITSIVQTALAQIDVSSTDHMRPVVFVSCVVAALRDRTNNSGTEHIFTDDEVTDCAVAMLKTMYSWAVACELRHGGK